MTATRATSTILAWLGAAALVVVAASAPAVAKKSKAQNDKPSEETIADIDNGEPMMLVVSLSKQKVDVYRGMTLITTSSVSTGMPGHATKLGVFSILEKQRIHHSNMYSGAPMPWMNRITWSGTALHAGVVPGYPASHGCIRLPFSFAPKLFQITTVGDNVVVSRDRLVPQLIEHPGLFQPLPPPAPPVMVKQEQPPGRQSSNEIGPLLPPKATHPGMLAKADVAGVTTDVPSSLEAEAADQDHGAPVPTQSQSANRVTAALTPGNAAEIEDTHVHAFDPYVGLAAAGERVQGLSVIPGNARGKHAAVDSSAVGSNGHAVEDDSDGSTPSTAEASATPLAASKETSAIKTAAPGAAASKEAPAAEAVTPTAAPATETPAIEAPQIVASTVAPPPAVVVVPVAATAPLPMPAEATARPIALPAPDAIPSIVAAKLDAGAKATAIQAAEPRSTAPLRILVTRRTQRDRIIGVQQLFAELGYLPPQDFDGTLGKTTASAIKAFQKANGMPETGAFTEELVKKVYEVAGKGEPPAGHLFVRQEFRRVFDAPVSFRNPEEPLGTHIFTAMKFAPGDTKTRWTAISLQGDDASSALDRLEIPDDLRQKISERLTPGSSLIIGDTAINTATLPKGADFLVWAKDTPAKITAASVDGDVSEPQPKRKKNRNVRGYNYNYSYSYPTQRGYGRGSPQWPW
jgi:peptidoglycan hydrolase-like protein with peptidoglycan-binding domain